MLEIRDRDALARLDAPGAGGPAVRIDASSEPVRCYSSSREALRALAHGLAPGDYGIRETNLEDLFLQATGSALDEDQ